MDKKDEFSKSQKEVIGGQLAHIPKKADTFLKSQQEWQTDQIAVTLVPALKNFLTEVPESRFAVDVKTECCNRLAKLHLPSIPTSLLSST